jgi:hypothetical protein
MRIKTYTLTGLTAAAASYAAAQTYTANVAFTLTGAAASINPPVELTFTSASDLSADTYTITGKDRNGFVITETIKGPPAGTVQTRKVYSAVTSIVANNTQAVNTVSVGNPQRVTSPWIATNLFMSRDNAPTSRGSTEIVTGAPTGKWEFSNENVTQISGEGAFVDGTVTSAPAATGDTASIQGAYIRYVVTSVTGTSLKIRVVRPSY